MQTKTAKVLPKTAGEIENGGVYSQAVRCGKKNCKCVRGETHTAFYFFTRRNRRLVKIYIRKAEFSEFSHLAVTAATLRNSRRQTTKADLDLLKQLRQSLRENASIVLSLKGK
jgi:hypothetical protein